MQPKLQSQFNRIEKLKKDLLDSLDALNENQLNFRIQPESWNRLQVVHHLVIVDKLTLAYMQRKIRSFANAKNISWTASFRSAFLTLIQRMPVKYKVPSNRIVSDGEIVYAELKEEWQAIRLDLQSFLEKFTSENIHYPILRHPIVGMLTIQQTLRFIEEHFKHHLRQFKRIGKSEKSERKS